MKKKNILISFIAALFVITLFGSFNHVHAGDETCPNCGSTGYIFDDLRSCTAPGQAYYHCDNCRNDWIINTPPLGHNYQDSPVASPVYPTCTTDGYVYQTCSRCGDPRTKTLPALGHNYTYTTTKEPTCLEAGERTHSCTRCSDSGTETIPSLGHNYSSTITKQATCLEEGEKTSTCTRCGDSKTETIPALGHKYVATTKKATCEETGKTTYKCSRCGDSYSKNIAALGHDFKEERTEPTCEEEGEIVKTCKRCKKVETEAIPALGHSYGEFEIIEEATCEKDGKKHAICSVCGKEDILTIPATGHSYPDEWTVEKEATLFKEGSEYKECKTCHKIINEAIPQKKFTESKPAMILSGVTALGVIAGTGFYMAKKSKPSATKSELEPLSLSSKIVSTCLRDNKQNNDFIDLLKKKHFIDTEIGSYEEIETIGESVHDAEPDLLIIDVEDEDELDGLHDIFEKSLEGYKDVSFGLILKDRSLEGFAKKLKENEDIMAYVFADDENNDKLVKLILPLYKPELSDTGTAENIGRIADALGVPLISRITSIYVTIKDKMDMAEEVKKTVKDGEIGISEGATIIGDIASILGFDEVASVVGLVDDISSIKDAFSEESGNYEKLAGGEAAKDIVDVVKDVIDK